MFTLEQLRSFVAVADELHFGRAAQRLAMTQPPLSRQVQKLEREVGCRLLDRDSRGVALTPAGEAFVVEARRLLALAASAPDLARRIDAGSAGTVRLGFTAASTLAELPRVLAGLGAALPDVDVVLTELRTADQVDAMLAGELDLGLARPGVGDPLLTTTLLSREALHVALPAGHRLAGHRLGEADGVDGVDPAALAGEPVIMHSLAGARYFHDLVTRLLPVASYDVVDAVGQVLTMVSLVSAGRGVAFVPASAARLGLDGVVLRPLAGLPPDPVELHLMWRTDSRNAALHRAVEHLRP